MDKIKLTESYRWHKYVGEVALDVPENTEVTSTENDVPAKHKEGEKHEHN